jgi:hypothetical protein
MWPFKKRNWIFPEIPPICHSCTNSIFPSFRCEGCCWYTKNDKDQNRFYKKEKRTFSDYGMLTPFEEKILARGPLWAFWKFCDVTSYLRGEKPMSREKEAVELLREMVHAYPKYPLPGDIMERADAFLAKHDIKKCHCGGTPDVQETMGGRYKVLCLGCGHAGKSSHTEHGAKRNWKFTQEAIAEKRINDAEKRRVSHDLLGTCSECGK